MKGERKRTDVEVVLVGKTVPGVQGCIHGVTDELSGAVVEI